MKHEIKSILEVLEGLKRNGYDTNLVEHDLKHILIVENSIIETLKKAKLTSSRTLNLKSIFNKLLQDYHSLYKGLNQADRKLIKLIQETSSFHQNQIEFLKFAPSEMFKEHISRHLPISCLVLDSFKDKLIVSIGAGISLLDYDFNVYHTINISENNLYINQIIVKESTGEALLNDTEQGLHFYVNLKKNGNQKIILHDHSTLGKLYEWQKQRIIFLSENNGFYVINYQSENFEAIKVSHEYTAQQFPKFFNAYKAIETYLHNNHFSIIKIDSNNSKLIFKDRRDNTVTLFDYIRKREIIKMPSPNLDYHDITAHGNMLVFIAKEALLIAKDNNVQLIKRKGFNFTRAKFIISKDNKVRLIALATSTQSLDMHSILIDFLPTIET